VDTWLKKVAYSRGSKGITLVAIYLVTFTLILSFTGITLFSTAPSYVDSAEFRELLVKKAGYLRDWIVRYDEDKIFSEEEITPEQIENYISASGKTMTKDEAIQGILTDRRNYYSMIQNELVITNKNLDYFAIDNETQRVITNMQGDNTDEIIKQLTNRADYLVGNGYYILNLKYGTDTHVSYYSDQYTMESNYYAGEKFEGQENYRVYVALKEVLVPGDDFYVGYKYLNSYQEQLKFLYNVCVVGIILLILLGIYWVCIVGKSNKSEGIVLGFWDRVPFEIECLMGVIGNIISFSLIVQFIRWKGDLIMSMGINGPNYKMLGIMIFCGICTLPISINLRLFSSWIKRLKSHTMLDHIMSYRLAREWYEHMPNKVKNFVLIIGIIGINILGDCILLFDIEEMFYSYGILAFMPIVIWNLLWGALILRLFIDYIKILQGAKAITQGELERKVELGKTLPILKEMADTVNSMGTGLEKAVGQSVKSEHLKTELITNVSHDLKTPLTSIISYIDLLKGENIDNPVAREYINVLDERSHRLKQLVEDLVEASKAVTGNLKAEIQPLQLDELVGQALGEYQDRMEMNGLVVMSQKMEPVCVSADGRYMWRIIENLLSNVCKYAMPHTRVYIEVYREGQYGYCIIKNISKEPLNMDTSELTERFVRGDTARTTEGSGLGLAIAESLIALQHGGLELTVDGDLFKAAVKIPLVESKPISLDKENK